MGEIAPDGRYVAHPHVGEPPHGVHDHAGAIRDLGRAFDVGEWRQGADHQAAIRRGRNARQSRDFAQTDQPGWVKHAGFHHQHQGGAAADGTHRPVVGIEEAQGLVDGRGFGKLERRHEVTPDVSVGNGRAKAASIFSANFRSISLALDLSTGWPMLPSLPVMLASIVYLTSVSLPASMRSVVDTAIKRPTMPSGVPSILASIRSGGDSRVTSTLTLKLNFMYAILVSRTAS